MRVLTADEAGKLAGRTDFNWWQSFELAPGVRTPGVNDIEALMARGRVPEDLSGLTVLDIGTANGGAAFTAERRGASRIVCVDICDDRWNGFAELRDALGSKAEFVRSSVYDLPSRPEIAGHSFDVVFFFGVLYHLRHPLLALDSLRAVVGGTAYLETAVGDAELPGVDGSASVFYRTDELNGDPTNWFSPNMACLLDWVRSAGFSSEVTFTWPGAAPQRAQVTLTPVPGPPEWQHISYELPVRATVELGPS